MDRVTGEGVSPFSPPNVANAGHQRRNPDGPMEIAGGRCGSARDDGPLFQSLPVGFLPFAEGRLQGICAGLGEILGLPELVLSFPFGPVPGFTDLFPGLGAGGKLLHLAYPDTGSC